MIIFDIILQNPSKNFSIKNFLLGIITKKLNCNGEGR